MLFGVKRKCQCCQENRCKRGRDGFDWIIQATAETRDWYCLTQKAKSLTLRPIGNEFLSHIFSHNHTEPRVFHEPDKEVENKGTRRGFKMLTCLDDTLDPLIGAFNHNKLKHRFIAILSPT
jgi:hypothetical protein